MTDWAKLKHLKGSAKALPGWVKRLTDAKPGKVYDAVERLDEALVGDAKWSAAAGPAVAAILDALPRVRVEIGAVLLLLADVIGQDHRKALDPKAKRPPKKVVVAVDAGWDGLHAQASSPDPTARAGFALVAATVRELAHRSLEPLLTLARDDDPFVRMSAVLALGALGGDEALATVRQLIEDEDEGVRGAAALAELSLREEVGIAERHEPLQGWLRFRRPREGTEFLWFATPGGSDVLGPLLAIADRRGAQTELLQLVIDNPGDAIRRVSELVVTLGGFVKDFMPDKRAGYVALLGELNADQRALAERLADSDLVPLGGFGLPAPGAARRRWLGLLPPAPIDHVVAMKRAGKSFEGPIWRVWYELCQLRQLDAADIDGLLRGLTPIDRWQVLIEIGAASYGGWSFDPDLVDQEVERVRGAAGLAERAEALAGELHRRFRSARGTSELLGLSVPQGLDGQSAALLMFPFMEGKRRWPEPWDRLLAISNDKLALRVAAALPTARRAALLPDWLEQIRVYDGKTAWLVTCVMDVLAIDPQPKLCDTVAAWAARDDMPAGSKMLLSDKLAKLG